VSADPSTRIARITDPWEAGLVALLRRLPAGALTVTMPDGRLHRVVAPQPGPDAEVVVRGRGVPRRLAVGGGIALAETYMEGLWDTPDLRAVLDLGLTNITLRRQAGARVTPRPLQRIWHRLRDNDPRGGSKRNIAHHYDLGNDFYGLWLDETMTYSSACLEDECDPLSDEALAAAQRRKWDRILELTQPSRRDHVLEVGCGWGGFAVHAAKEAGCRVTGLTLSEQQLVRARELVEREGLEGLVDIRLQDYRDVRGTFDRIASIEMFEAVGERWWPVFFGQMRALLAPGGVAAMQVITLDDAGFANYRNRPDFIQRYVFPGGMLPSPSAFAAAATAAGLSADEPRFFGADYARTLGAWSDRFEQALPQVRDLGFDERFIRMWRYYLAYCRTGFEHKTIDVMQVRLQG